MPTYSEVVTQVYRLSKAEQIQLLEELKAIVVNESIKVDEETELIPTVELNISETSWQDYITGRDRGKSLQKVELELFGRELD